MIKELWHYDSKKLIFLDFMLRPSDEINDYKHHYLKSIIVVIYGVKPLFISLSCVILVLNYYIYRATNQRRVLVKARPITSQKTLNPPITIMDVAS